MKVSKHIQLWSGPRNISTALMYSFAQRDDTHVIDEPLYAHYLRETGLPHPGREEVLQSMKQDGAKVMEGLLSYESDQPVLFCKQMTHHLINIDLNYLANSFNLILIRDPMQVLHSYAEVIEKPSLQDIGIKQSYELLNFLSGKNYLCMVIDANQLLKDSRQVLTIICQAAGIGFQSSMLNWKAGPRPEDGVWAKYWYKNVHQSTGFVPFAEHEYELQPHLREIYEAARPYYDFLFERAIKPAKNQLII